MKRLYPAILCVAGIILILFFPLIHWINNLALSYMQITIECWPEIVAGAICLAFGATLSP